MAKKSNVTLSDFSTWSLPLVLLAGIIIVCLFVFLAQRFLVSDLSSQIATVDGQIKVEESKYEKNQRIVAMLPHIRKEVAELEIIRDDAKKYLPTKVSMPSLIDNVYLAARDNGIVFKDFMPEEDVDTEYYTIKPISLTAEVGYLSMSSFIEQITTLRRIMNVQSVSFSRTQGLAGDELTSLTDEPLEMSAMLQTYIFKESDQGDKANKK